MWIYGNGGHAKVVRDLIYSNGKNIHTIDDADPAFPWKDEYVTHQGIVAIGDNRTRKRIVLELEAKGVRFSTLYVWQQKPGTVVMHGAVIAPGCTIGRHVIINHLANVDHDCKIGDFAHIAPGVTLCGNVTVGEGTFIGAGSVVTPGVKIGAWKQFRAGSVVTEDVA